MTEEKPLTREDVLKLIKEHGGPDGLDLSRMNLKWIDLAGEPDQHLDLHGIILKGSNLEGAYLAYANLQDAILTQSNLERAYVMHADLQKAELSFANLQLALLDHANMQKAKLWHSNLQFARLVLSNLRQAKLIYTDLRGANLEFSELHNTYLEGVIIDSNTRLQDIDWGREYIIGEEINKNFELAYSVYSTLEWWHVQAGFGNLASQFAFRRLESRRQMLGAKSLRAFKQVFR